MKKFSILIMVLFVGIGLVGCQAGDGYGSGGGSGGEDSPQGSYILVTSPNDGENWEKGKTYEITWSSENMGVYTYVDIELCLESVCEEIVSSADNDGSYNWTVPVDLEVGSDYVVKVTDSSNSSNYDESDAGFVIFEENLITVISPNGGENWEKGSVYEITWSSLNVGENMDIELCQEGVCSTVAFSTFNDGSYNWTIPMGLEVGSDYKIKISDSVNSSYLDESDSTFDISFDDHGNDISTSTVVDENSTTSGNLEVEGDFDFFKIIVSFNGALLVSTTGSTDTYGVLLDSSGDILIEDDDNGDGDNFSLSDFVVAGTYYVGVRGQNSSDTGAYSFVSSFDADYLTPLVGKWRRMQEGVFSRIEFYSDSTFRYEFIDNGTSGYVVAVISEITINSFHMEVTESSDESLIGYSDEWPYSLSGDQFTLDSMVFDKYDDDHGNDFSTATLLSLLGTTFGDIEVGGDEDFFKIVISSAGTLSISTTGSTDTYGYLLDSSGNVLLENDDSGSGFNFSLSYSVVVGTYYVRVRGYSASTTGDYSLVSSFDEDVVVVEDDHGNSMSTATVIDKNSTTSGNIGDGDEDFFKIVISSGGTLSVSITGGFTITGFLLDSSGNVLDSDWGDDFSLSRSVSTGTYYVRLVASFSESGDYSIVTSYY